MTLPEAIKRIAEIDARFEAAHSWGSWMAGLSTERKNLAEKIGAPHKWEFQRIKEDQN